MSCCQCTWHSKIPCLLYSVTENGVEEIDGINGSFAKNILIPFDTFKVKLPHEDFGCILSVFTGFMLILETLWSKM